MDTEDHSPEQDPKDTDESELLENLSIEDQEPDELYQVIEGLTTATFKPLDSYVYSCSHKDPKTMMVLFAVLVQCMSSSMRKKYNDADEYEIRRIIQRIKFRFDQTEFDMSFTEAIFALYKCNFILKNVHFKSNHFQDLVSVLVSGKNELDHREILEKAHMFYSNRFGKPKQKK